MKKLRIIVGLILSSLLLIVPALAQTANTGALTGIVTDANGAIVSGAQVRVISEATGEERTVVANEAGNYTVPLLLPGSYRVEFTGTGFKKSVKSALQISVTETTRLDVQLEVGSVQEQVTVTSQAELLQTESSALGRVVDSTGISNLPRRRARSRNRRRVRWKFPLARRFFPGQQLSTKRRTK